jgi:uncharacterized protein YciI
MKTFVVALNEKQPQLMTQQLLEAHCDYLHRLADAGNLRFCGPCLDGTALMVLNAIDEPAARSIVENDPFAAVDYYRSRRVVEIEEANVDNDFLRVRSTEKIAGRVQV